MSRRRNPDEPPADGPAVPLPWPPPDDPFSLLARWLDLAQDHVRHPLAACLSTVREDSTADGRIVLVHALRDGAFLFGTDERSPKAAQLAVRPGAALTFHWRPLDAQVRVRGSVAAGNRAWADRTFEDRPRRSRAVAWALPQSQPIDGPESLRSAVETVDRRLGADDPIPRPPSWRALWLHAEEIELWRAGARRLHRRVLWRRRRKGWAVECLAP